MVRCSSCGDRLQKYSWAGHKLLHNTETHQCPHCDTVTSRADALQDHRLTAHADYTDREYLRGTTNPKVLKRFVVQILRDHEVIPDLAHLTEKISALKEKEKKARIIVQGWKPNHCIDLTYVGPTVGEIAHMKRDVLVDLCILHRQMLAQDWDGANKEVDGILATV